MSATTSGDTSSGATPGEHLLILAMDEFNHFLLFSLMFASGPYRTSCRCSYVRCEIKRGAIEHVHLVRRKWLQVLLFED